MNTSLEANYYVDFELIKLIIQTEQQPDIGFNILAQCGGYLINGTLIAYKEWFEWFSCKDKRSPEEQVDIETITGNANRNPDDGERRYIHLKNVKFYAGKNEIPNGESDMYWRGKLVDISGFTLASLTIREEPFAPKVFVGSKELEMKEKI